MVESDRILTFAVSSDEHIAVGFYNESAINIYDKNGDFEYSYHFNPNDRRTYRVEYNNNDLQIVLWSSSRQVVSIEDEGENVEISNIPMTSEFNSYLNEIHNTNQRQTNKNTYQMRNGGSGLAKFFIKGYTQIVRNSNGEEEILVDVSDKANSKAVIISFAILVLFLTLISSMLFYAKKKRKDTKDQMR